MLHTITEKINIDKQMDQVLLAASGIDLSPYLTFARKHDMGLELQAFADPKTLSNNWMDSLAFQRRQLAGFRGRIGVHGAFFDMNSASLDPAIVRLTRERYRQNLVVAASLKADYLVFHLNYLGLMKLQNYRPGWHQRQLDFWGSFVEEAAVDGVPLLLENSWEDDPTLITDILQEINSPYLGACLDVAHATLYSPFPFDIWLKTFAPYLTCSHLNNHDGNLDLHWPLHKGVVDYEPVLAALRRLPRQPLFCLEMPGIAQFEASLDLLRLNHTSIL